MHVMPLCPFDEHLRLLTLRLNSDQIHSPVPTPTTTAATETILQ
jgi:hypothetical protein